MKLMTPPDWYGYPNHEHDATLDDANQEEVDVPLVGSGRLTPTTNPYFSRRLGARGGDAGAIPLSRLGDRSDRTPLARPPFASTT